MNGFSPGNINVEAETHKEKTIRHPFHSHTLQLISLSRTSVRSDVFGEVARPGEALATLVTLERFLTW